MGDSGHFILTVILAGSAIYHLLVGILSMCSVKAIRRIGKVLYGLDIPLELDPRYEYTWKPLGAYAVCIGLIAWHALTVQDPVYRLFVIRLLAFLYLMRAVCRLIYRDLFTRAFGTPFKRNAINIAFNLALVVLMLGLSPT